MSSSSNARVWPKINASTVTEGTFSYLDAGAEQDIVELTPTTRIFLHGAWIDTVNMTQNGTVKLYYKIDGTNYRQFNSTTFTVATDDGLWIDLNAIIDDDFKITWTEGADEGAARDIIYQVFYSEVQ